MSDAEELDRIGQEFGDPDAWADYLPYFEDEPADELDEELQYIPAEDRHERAASEEEA